MKKLKMIGMLFVMLFLVGILPTKAHAEGWVQEENGSWYYLNQAGEKAKETWIGNYYVDENGIWDSSKIAKWQISNGRWWYSHADGSYTTNGWESIDGEWYYFDESGYMASSCWIGVYYVKENGKMAHSEWVDNGRYYVDENGVWVQGVAAY